MLEFAWASRIWCLRVLGALLEYAWILLCHVLLLFHVAAVPDVDFTHLIRGVWIKGLHVEASLMSIPCTSGVHRLRHTLSRHRKANPRPHNLQTTDPETCTSQPFGSVANPRSGRGSCSSINLPNPIPQPPSPESLIITSHVYTSHLSLLEHITSQPVHVVLVNDLSLSVPLSRRVDRHDFDPKLCESRVVDDGLGVWEAVPRLLLSMV